MMFAMTAGRHEVNRQVHGQLMVAIPINRGLINDPV
jgi:hypothetical protein